MKRVGTGAGSSALGQAILAGQAILLVPFFLRAWGANGYGHWLALTAFVSYISLLDLGGQNYIGNLLAMSHARSDEESFRNTLSEGVSLFLLIGVSGLSILISLILIFLNLSIPGMERTLTGWEAGVLALLGSQFLMLNIPAGVYVTVYRSAGLFTRGQMLGNTIRGLGIIFYALLLYWMVTPLAYAAGMVGVGAIHTFVVVWDTRRHIPACRGIHLSLRQARKGWIHLKGALYFWVLSLSQAIKHQGVLLVLAAAASPAVVALYATHRTLVNISGYVGTLVQGPLLPELSFLWAQQRRSHLTHTCFITIRGVLFATGMVAILLWLLAPLAYPAWTGRQLQLHSVLLALLLSQGVLAGGWKTASWGLLATNHHRPIAAWTFVNSVFSIGLAVLLGREYGVIGVALAVLVGDMLFGLVIFPIKTSRFLQISPIRIFGEIAAALAVVFGFLGIAGLLGHFLTGWWPVVVFTLVGLLLFYPTMRLIVGSTAARQTLNTLWAAWS